MCKERLRRRELFRWAKTRRRPYCCSSLLTRGAQRGWSQTLLGGAQTQDETPDTGRKIFILRRRSNLGTGNQTGRRISVPGAVTAQLGSALIDPVLNGELDHKAPESLSTKITPQFCDFRLQ